MEKIKSKGVVEIVDGKITRKWSSVSKCAKDLYLTRQTIMNYCNNKTKNKAFNLMWEEDYGKERGKNHD